MQINLRARTATIGTLALGLSACAPQNTTLYSWQSYQPAVYDYLKDADSDPAAQLIIMEKDAETARASGRALPPGFHAHMALLYLKTGQHDKAVEGFNAEKTAFPESAPFMDFLLARKTVNHGPAQAGSRAGNKNAAKGK